MGIILGSRSISSSMRLEEPTLSGLHPASFDTAELAVVLSYYDLGIIESCTPFAKGSRLSPKMGIVAEGGKFLLKRRAPRRADPHRVLVSHRVQQALEQADFPVPRLIPAKPDGDSFVQIREHVYELFQFVPGQGFQFQPEEASHAGEVLAAFHEATGALAADWTGPEGDYHDGPAIRTGLCSIGSRLSMHDSFTGDAAELEQMIQTLLKIYDRAADTVNGAGLPDWPHTVVHADWHPGNLLFRKGRVVAVIDYDAVRLSPRATDVANGALQFSMVSGGDPSQWPDGLARERYAAFLGGYDRTAPLTADEVHCLPHLMIEALIAECVPPIAATGSVGKWEGYRVLQMVCRKTKWIGEHQQNIVEVLPPR